MAIFTKQSKNTTKDVKVPEKKAIMVPTNISRILTKPRMTEKATEGNMSGVYVFDVARDANKKQIAEAMRLVYKVDPVKIRVINIPSKKTRNARTGIMGVKGGGKKAYIYLRAGDSISVM